jgi:hypothetical protein
LIDVPIAAVAEVYGKRGRHQSPALTRIITGITFAVEEGKEMVGDAGIEPATPPV